MEIPTCFTRKVRTAGVRDVASNCLSLSRGCANPLIKHRITKLSRYGCSDQFKRRRACGENGTISWEGERCNLWNALCNTRVFSAREATLVAKEVTSTRGDPRDFAGLVKAHVRFYARRFSFTFHACQRTQSHVLIRWPAVVSNFSRETNNNKIS